LKVYGIARAAQALAPRVALPFLFNSIVRSCCYIMRLSKAELPRSSIRLWHKSDSTETCKRYFPKSHYLK